MKTLRPLQVYYLCLRIVYTLFLFSFIQKHFEEKKPILSTETVDSLVMGDKIRKKDKIHILNSKFHAWLVIPFVLWNAGYGMYDFFGFNKTNSYVANRINVYFWNAWLINSVVLMQRRMDMSGVYNDNFKGLSHRPLTLILNWLVGNICMEYIGKASIITEIGGKLNRTDRMIGNASSAYNIGNIVGFFAVFVLSKGRILKKPGTVIESLGSVDGKTTGFLMFLLILCGQQSWYNLRTTVNSGNFIKFRKRNNATVILLFQFILFLVSENVKKAKKQSNVPQTFMKSAIKVAPQGFLSFLMGYVVYLRRL